MGSQRAGHVVKACLPECNIVEQSLDKNHRGAVPDLLPCVQVTLAAGQKAMREGSPGATPVEVDDVSALAQREDNALIESIRAVRVEQADLAQQIVGITQCRQMTA